MIFGLSYYSFASRIEDNETFVQDNQYNLLGSKLFYLDIFCSSENSFFVRFACWILGLVFLFIGTYLFIEITSTNSVYIGLLVLKELFFSIGVMLYLTPILANRFYFVGGWIKEGFFVYLSKLTYSACVISSLVIYSIVFNFRSTLYFSSIYLMIWVLSFTTLSFLGGMVFTAAFEIPLLKVYQRYRKVD